MTAGPDTQFADGLGAPSAGISRWTDLSGPVRYLDFGGPADGPVVVCVHGLGGSAVNWTAMTAWSRSPRRARPPAPNPAWSLREFPGVGHVPQLEVPRQTADVILDWLGSVGQRAARAARSPGRA
jgi:pimeloyl-ACP methyl ester carboxylesterase